MAGSKHLQFSAYHLAHGTDGVRQTLTADVSDETSIWRAKRHLPKVASDPYRHRLTGIVSKAGRDLVKESSNGVCMRQL